MNILLHSLHSLLSLHSLQTLHSCLYKLSNNVKDAKKEECNHISRMQGAGLMAFRGVNAIETW